MMKSDLARDLIDDQLQPIVDLCQKWLRYQDPAVTARRTAAISAPVQRFDDNKGGGANMLGGAYMPVLREAQFFWAAQKVSNDMRRDAAFARRNFRQAYKISRYLMGKHRVEWLSWTGTHPTFSVDLLIQDIAIEMAVRLGSDIL